MTEVSCFLGTLLESPEVSAAFRCLDEIGGYLGSCSCNMNSSLSSWLACSEQLSILPVTGSLVIEFGGYGALQYHHCCSREGPQCWSPPDDFQTSLLDLESALNNSQSSGLWVEPVLVARTELKKAGDSGEMRESMV